MTPLEQLAYYKCKDQEMTNDQAYIKGVKWAMEQIHVQIKCEYLRKTIPAEVTDFLNWYAKLNQDYTPGWPVKSTTSIHED